LPLGRLQHFSTRFERRLFQQRDCAFNHRRTQVHVSLRRDQIWRPANRGPCQTPKREDCVKKTKSASRPTSRRKPPITVDDYVAGLPNPARSGLSQLRQAIRSVVPRQSTEVISYRIPAFKDGGILVWYAAFANHVSLFPGGSVLTRFGEELKTFKTSKGTIQFPLDAPLPIGLIKRIVKARVAEVQEKKRR
jgi:uncharacterized protein YdhG (YjbR/CyaY superfamily)